MIFATVGTHEQQFNRLLMELDRLANLINEEIIIQSGYSTYEVKNCKAYKMISADMMNQYINDARIVITHGGPGSIMMPLLINKKPIVVPRQKKFKEHINDHQVYFTQHLEAENKIIAIYDIKNLEAAILNYSDEKIDLNIQEHTLEFTNKLESEINKLFE